MWEYSIPWCPSVREQTVKIGFNLDRIKTIPWENDLSIRSRTTSRLNDFFSLSLSKENSSNCSSAIDDFSKRIRTTIYADHSENRTRVIRTRYPLPRVGREGGTGWRRRGRSASGATVEGTCPTPHAAAADRTVSVCLSEGYAVTWTPANRTRCSCWATRTLAKRVWCTGSATRRTTTRTYQP